MVPPQKNDTSGDHHFSHDSAVSSVQQHNEAIEECDCPENDHENICLNKVADSEVEIQCHHHDNLHGYVTKETPDTIAVEEEEDDTNTTTVNVITNNNNNNDQCRRSRREFLCETILREMIAEMSGTFIIVQLGTGAVMSAIFQNNGGGGIANDDLVSIAIVWMIAVTIAISISASISGAHLNPAITLAFVTVRRTIGWYKVIPYIVAQFIGAILASIVNYYIYYDAIQQYEMTNDIIRSSTNAIPSAKAFGEYYSTSTSVLRAFFVEAFGTFILAVVVFALTHPTNELIRKNDGSNHEVFIPPLIGCTVGALISVLAPITQAGFNPARDFGPRIVAYIAGWTSVAFLPQHSWLVYIFGPIVGAIMGAAYVDFMLFRPK